jgi:hypothetical protein
MRAFYTRSSPTGGTFANLVELEKALAETLTQEVTCLTQEGRIEK